MLLATRGGMVCSYDRADGAQQWCLPVAGVADRRPTLIAAGDDLIVATRSSVVAIDADAGTLVWEKRADTPIVTVDGDADTVVLGDTAGTVRALEPASGRQRWQLALEGQPDLTSLAVADDAVYAGTRDGAVLRVRPADTAP
ncbi:hypothetical protein BH23ACT10_BH23ACT10_39510 [soil metagenome]